MRVRLLMTCWVITLLLAGCTSDPLAAFTSDLFNIWNEYADICSRIDSEKSAEHYFKLKLTPLKEKWDAMDVRRQELYRIDKDDKKALLALINGRWGAEGTATMERLVHAQKRLRDVMAEERAQREQEGEALKGKPEQDFPFLTKSITLRDTFDMDFSFALPRKDPQKPGPEVKLNWTYPKKK